MTLVHKHPKRLLAKCVCIRDDAIHSQLDAGTRSEYLTLFPATINCCWLWTPLRVARRVVSGHRREWCAVVHCCPGRKCIERDGNHTRRLSRFSPAPLGRHWHADEGVKSHSRTEHSNEVAGVRWHQLFNELVSFFRHIFLSNQFFSSSYNR